MNRINILGVGFDNVSMTEAVQKAYECMKQRNGSFVVTPNPEIIMSARENDALKHTIEQAALVLPDGIGVIYGAKILKTSLKERVPGIDFASGLMEQLAREEGSVYLLGAKPGVAEKAAENLTVKHHGLRILGYHDGYFTDDTPIIEDINRLKPDLLLVCLGFPKQEFWMRDHAEVLDVGLMAGLGGSLDVFAGVVQRAPVMWRKLGLEWLYRLLKEPSRLGRMVKLPQFLLCVLKESVKR